MYLWVCQRKNDPHINGCYSLKINFKGLGVFFHCPPEQMLPRNPPNQIAIYVSVGVHNPQAADLYHVLQHVYGLMQERRNSIANALELRLSCTNPSMCSHYLQGNVLGLVPDNQWLEFRIGWFEKYALDAMSSVQFVPYSYQGDKGKSWSYI